MDIPVPDEAVEVEIERLDVEWFNLTPVSFRQNHPVWQDQFPELYKRYVEDVLALGLINDSDLVAEILRFTNNQTISEVQHKTLDAYPNLDQVEQDLTAAWKYYAYYFPDRTIPNHATVITGFNTPAILTQNGIGIGLEMYLGADCPFYDYLQIPVYLRQRMTPQHLVPTVIHGWLESEFPLETADPTLLEEMVHAGKLLYCMDALFPKMADSIKIGYSAEGLDWAHNHERNVWAYFIDKELLFTTERNQIAKFMNDGPFTVDLVKESPSRMGAFVGWQMVRTFMNQQDKIDLPGLIDLNAEQILNQSKYKP